MNKKWFFLPLLTLSITSIVSCQFLKEKEKDGSKDTQSPAKKELIFEEKFPNFTKINTNIKRYGSYNDSIHRSLKYGVFFEDGTISDEYFLYILKTLEKNFDDSNLTKLKKEIESNKLNYIRKYDLVIINSYQKYLEIFPRKFFENWASPYNEEFFKKSFLVLNRALFDYSTTGSGIHIQPDIKNTYFDSKTNSIVLNTVFPYSFLPAKQVYVTTDIYDISIGFLIEISRDQFSNEIDIEKLNIKLVDSETLEYQEPNFKKNKK